MTALNLNFFLLCMPCAERRGGARRGEGVRGEERGCCWHARQWDTRLRGEERGCCWHARQWDTRMWCKRRIPIRGWKAEFSAAPINKWIELFLSSVHVYQNKLSCVRWLLSLLSFSTACYIELTRTILDPLRHCGEDVLHMHAWTANVQQPHMLSNTCMGKQAALHALIHACST